MAEENNPSGQVAKEDPSGNTPASNTPDGSDANVSAAELQRRQEQSERDKTQSSATDDVAERLGSLEAREAERARDQYVADFVGKNPDKYANVKPSDPLFKYATSQEDVEAIAKEIQNRFTELQQEALQSVQLGSEEVSLTDAEILEEEAKLEEQTKKSGASGFGAYFNLQQRRKR